MTGGRGKEADVERRQKEFGRALRKELKRGIKGETDNMPENAWATELGPEWSYGAGLTGLLPG